MNCSNERHMVTVALAELANAIRALEERIDEMEQEAFGFMDIIEQYEMQEDDHK